MSAENNIIHDCKGFIVSLERKSIYRITINEDSIIYLTELCTALIKIIKRAIY